MSDLEEDEYVEPTYEVSEEDAAKLQQAQELIRSTQFWIDHHCSEDYDWSLWMADYYISQHLKEQWWK